MSKAIVIEGTEECQRRIPFEFHKFTSLLSDNGKNSKFIKWLNNNQNLKVLDLWCGSCPDNLIKIYHEFKFSILKGIDFFPFKVDQETYTKKRLPPFTSRDQDYKYYYDKYYRGLFSSGKISELRKPIMDEKCYESFIKRNIDFDTHMLEFLSENQKDVYDLVIAQNSLHWLNRENEVLDTLRAIRKILQLENGHYFFSIYPKFGHTKSMDYENWCSVFESYFPDTPPIVLKGDGKVQSILHQNIFEV